jgi:hypothetical protein
VPFPNGLFGAAPGLRIRPVPDWDGCLVFDPGRRRLVELNLAAWLLLELAAAESDLETLLGRYDDAIASRSGSPSTRGDALNGLAQLMREGLLRITGESPSRSMETPPFEPARPSIT